MDDAVEVPLEPDDVPVQGSVQTPAGEPVEAATVTVRDGETAVTSVTTASDGTYALSVGPGSYTLAVTADGQDAVNTSLEISVGIGIVLEPSAAPALETDAADDGLPGFGAAVALVALLTVACHRTRR